MGPHGKPKPQLKGTTGTLDMFENFNSKGKPSYGNLKGTTGTQDNIGNLRDKGAPGHNPKEVDKFRKDIQPSVNKAASDNRRQRISDAEGPKPKGGDPKSGRLGETAGPKKPTQVPNGAKKLSGSSAPTSKVKGGAKAIVEQFYKQHGDEGLRELAQVAVKTSPNVLKGILMGTGVGTALVSAFQYLQGSPTSANDTMEGRDAQALLGGNAADDTMNAGEGDFVPPSPFNGDPGLQEDMPPIPPMSPMMPEPMGRTTPNFPMRAGPASMQMPAMRPQTPPMAPQGMPPQGMTQGSPMPPNAAGGPPRPTGAPQTGGGSPGGRQNVPTTQEDSMYGRPAAGGGPMPPPAQPQGGMGQGGQMGGNLDALDFKQAFAQARKTLGPNGIFEWKGKKFTTKLKEEVKR